MIKTKENDWIGLVPQCLPKYDKQYIDQKGTACRTSAVPSVYDHYKDTWYYESEDWYPNYRVYD